MNTSHDINFAKMLEDSIDDKINQSREEMNEYHNPIFNQSLLIEIQALEWIQGKIQDLILDNVTTDWQFYDDANND
jgi:hypothetical protein